MVFYLYYCCISIPIYILQRFYPCTSYKKKCTCTCTYSPCFLALPFHHFITLVSQTINHKDTRLLYGPFTLAYAGVIVIAHGL